MADLDNDGLAEVIVASWPQSTSSAPARPGKLHILDYQGTQLHELDLPAPKSSARFTNGSLATPTLANVDADADLELVLNTVNSGVVVYDLPGTANAKVLWGTGRQGQTYVPATPLGPGDIDRNGLINLADAVIGLKNTAGIQTSHEVLESDVNGDTRIGVEDVIFILQKVSGAR